MAEQSGRREYVSLAIVVAVLVAAVWLARSHAEWLKEFIDHHAIQGAAVYIALNIIDAVIAPGATLPLIPIAARAGDASQPRSSPQSVGPPAPSSRSTLRVDGERRS